MVGHQDIGIDLTLAGAFGLLQGGSIVVVIVLREEDHLLIITALDDMMRIGRDDLRGRRVP